jgi:hypothetical protein
MMDGEGVHTKRWRGGIYKEVRGYGEGVQQEKGAKRFGGSEQQVAPAWMDSEWAGGWEGGPGELRLVSILDDVGAVTNPSKAHASPHERTRFPSSFEASIGKGWGHQEQMGRFACHTHTAQRKPSAHVSPIHTRTTLAAERTTQIGPGSRAFQTIQIAQIAPQRSKKGTYSSGKGALSPGLNTTLKGMHVEHEMRVPGGANKKRCAGPKCWAQKRPQPRGHGGATQPDALALVEKNRPHLIKTSRDRFTT